jgi:hypothetical protein
VEAPGIEPPATYVRSVAKRREDDADLATKCNERRREVLASSGRARRPLSAVPIDPEEALKVAIVAAVFAADTERARALLDLLDAKPTVPVLVQAPNMRRSDIDCRASGHPNGSAWRKLR